MTRDSWIYRPANANGDGTIRRQLHKTDISKLGGWSADGTGTSQNKATEWTVDEPRPYPTRNEDVEYAPISITTILLVSFIVILLVVMLLTYWRIVIRRQLNNHHSTTGGAASGTPADSKRQTARIRREKILSYFERSKDEMVRKY